MRKIFTSMLILFLSLSVYSQNCSAPLSGMVFKQKYNQLSAIRQDQQRLTSASEFARKNCMLVYQVKQVAELFNDDITRLSFVQNAFPAIFDKENIYDLYDAFAYFSTVMRFHDFIDDQAQRTGRRERYSDIHDKPYTFPNYNYPSYENYREKTPCSQPLSDEVFLRLLRNITMHNDDDSRILAAMQLAESNCLTVAQIMKMGSFIEKEAKRLDYLKRTYDYTYDNGNFQYSNQLLKEKTYTADFDNFMRDRRNKPGKEYGYKGHGGNSCRVSDTELQEIINNIKAQSFENTQLNMAKQIVRSKQCFTTLQIKEIIEVFTFEKSKLDIAKYCYGYCIDRGDYYKINSSFTFSSSADELTKFISEQQ